MVEQREAENKVGDLFAMEDIKESDFFIEYRGKIVHEPMDSEYRMKINGMDLWIESRKKRSIKLHESLVRAKLCARIMVH
jgi:hypothetical protein